MKAYQDPRHEGNSAAHHSGKPCIEPGCDKPAGTAWSHLWCHGCNVVRMDRISRNLEGAVRRGGQGGVDKLVELLRKTGGTAREHHPVGVELPPLE